MQLHIITMFPIGWLEAQNIHETFRQRICMFQYAFITLHLAVDEYASV